MLSIGAIYQGKTLKPLEERYLQLIDSALAIPLENKEFVQFLDSALEYFYGSEKTGTPAADLGKVDTQKPMLQADRINRLFEAAAARSSNNPDNSSLATLHFQGRNVEGNTAAAAMFNCTFPARSHDLPIDDTLRIAVSEMSSPLQSTDAPRLVLAQLDLEDSPVSLAVLRPKPSGGVQVTFSFVDWSEARVDLIGKALGLTGSERAVLRGHLQGYTRREIAEIRGTSEETVKAQSASILQKTGSSRVSELVPLATSLAFVLGAAPLPENSGETEATVGANVYKLNRGNRSIEYRRFGKAANIVVFQHGQMAGPFFTKAFLARLTDTNVSIIAPSRPGYGGTSRHNASEDYLQTVLADAQAVMAHLNANRVIVAGHQIGCTYAVALAEELKDKARAVVLLNGGAPLNEDSFAHMDRWSRMVATGIRYAPAVIRMATNLAIGEYSRRSAASFVRDRYSGIPEDKEALQNPEILELNCRGAEHLAEQDGISFVDDQKLKLSDWSQRYYNLGCRSLWLLPSQCRITPFEHVERFARTHPLAQVETIEHAGSLALYSHDMEMADRIMHFLSTLDS